VSGRLPLQKKALLRIPDFLMEEKDTGRRNNVACANPPN